MKRLINCTPHEVHILHPECVDFSNPRKLTLLEGIEKQIKMTIPPSGIVLNATGRTVLPVTAFPELEGIAITTEFTSVDDPSEVISAFQEKVIICSTTYKVEAKKYLDNYIFCSPAGIVRYPDSSMVAGCLHLDFS